MNKIELENQWTIPFFTTCRDLKIILHHWIPRLEKATPLELCEEMWSSGSDVGWHTFREDFFVIMLSYLHDSIFQADVDNNNSGFYMKHMITSKMLYDRYIGDPSTVI